jgi:hypothetical protein
MSAITRSWQKCDAHFELLATRAVLTRPHDGYTLKENCKEGANGISNGDEHERKRGVANDACWKEPDEELEYRELNEHQA